MDTRRDCFHGLIPAMVVDVVEGLSDFLLDNVTVWHLTYPPDLCEEMYDTSRPAEAFDNR
jgi:hypothetical protein